MFDRLVPIPLVLVDRDEMTQRRRRVGIHRHQVTEQCLGAIKQPGPHVVLAQLQQGHRFHGVIQAGARHQVLMQTNGAIHFTATAEQITERQVGFHRIAVVLGEFEEHLDRLVLLFIEQVVQATKIVG